jgi:hypothetical protein
MQIKVAPNPTPKSIAGGALGTAQWVDNVLNPALKAAYAASQDAPLVAQPIYDQAFGNGASGGNKQLGTIFVGSNSQLNVNFVDGAGVSKKYCVPNVIPAVAGATTFPDNLSSLQLPQGCDGPILNKAIQELFDKYGRMNATLGMELPATTATTQTTIPLGYIDPVTESLPAGETQIWKITHNGVDAHPVHFHLLNVQVLNRVGWDGTLKEPEGGETGWKETVKMNPLEDVIIAVKAARLPALPGFGLPKSVRAMDPSKPISNPLIASTMNPPDFMNLDPYTNAAPAGGQQNVSYDYDWEYVWHCHILGHEENDFMRPFVFTGMSVPPKNATQAQVAAATYADSRPGAAGNALAALPSGAPSGLALNGNTLSWSDHSQNEFRFDVQKAAVTAGVQTRSIQGRTYYVMGGATTGAFSTIASTLANAQQWTSPTPLPTSGAAFQVVSVAAGGTAASNVVTLPAAAPLPVAATNLAASQIANNSLTLAWNNPAPTATAGVPTSTTAGCSGNPVCTASVTNWSTATPITNAAYTSGNFNHQFSNLSANAVYTFQVNNTNGAGTTQSSALQVLTLPATPVAPTVANGPNNGNTRSQVLTFTQSSGLTYTVTVQRRSGGNSLNGVVVSLTATGATVTGLARGTQYRYTITASNTAAATGGIVGGGTATSGNSATVTTAN